MEKKVVREGEKAKKVEDKKEKKKDKEGTSASTSRERASAASSSDELGPLKREKEPAERLNAGLTSSSSAAVASSDSGLEEVT